MKILISTGLFPNRIDRNRGVFILRQALALRRHAEIRVIAPVPYFPSFIQSRRYSGYANVPRKDTFEGFDVLYPRYVVIPKIFRFLHGFFLLLSVFRTYRSVINEFKPDVIFGFFAYPYGFATVCIAKALRIPVVTGARGSDINIMAKSGLRRRLIAWTLKSSDRVFSVCSALKTEMVGMGVDPDQIVVIPNGIDRKRFVEMSQSRARSIVGMNKDGRVALCVANLSPVKGVDILIRAFERIRGKNIGLYIVGDGTERSSLEMLTRELNLEGRVNLVGAKPHSEIPLWIHACDLFVLPSRAEGYPNAVLEALSCGRPVVAARVGGVPEIVTSEELGLLANPEDPGDLARAIERAFDMEWNHDRLRKRGLLRTWDDVAQEILRETEAMLGCSGS